MSWSPANLREVAEAVSQAAADGLRLELRGAGSKATYGGPRPSNAVLSLEGLSAVTSYDPAELVLTAEAGTPLSALEPMLAEQSQMLAFEPPDLGPLLGEPAGAGTLGGALAANLAGPRRVLMGAARDHFLGFEAVSGRGLAFKAGGRVVKNVTGFDLPKLMAGSWGSLAALTTVTVKVVPRPRAAVSVVIPGLTDPAAIRAMTAAMRLPVEVSGAAHLPAAVSRTGQPVTLLRLEGFGPSVAARVERLKTAFASLGDLTVTGDEETTRLWRRIGSVGPLADAPGDLWRITAAPSRGGAVVEALNGLAGRWFYDWAGGLVWLAVPAGSGAQVRAATQAQGGHAVLVRAAAVPDVPGFPTPPEGLAALTARVRTAFDPQRVFIDRREPA